VKHGNSIVGIMIARERLLARCDAQRDQLAVLAQELQGPLHVADRALGAVNYVRRHPVVLGAAIAALAVFGRRNLWRWLRRGFVVWRTYRLLGGSVFKSAI
jgi:hypothetical protein